MSHSIALNDCTNRWVVSAFADEAGGSMDEQIAALNKAGLRHIDPRGVEGHNISELPLDVAERFKAKLDDAGIRVLMYGSPIGKIDCADDFEIDLKKLRHLAELREVFGANAVRIFSYYNDGGRLDEAAWRDETLRRLKELKNLAGELGMVLFHENESGIYGDTSEHVLQIAEALRDPADAQPQVFRLIYDFDNYNRTDEDNWSIWQKLKPLTDAFHLKDSAEGGEHVPLGQGKGFAREILDDAMKSGWCGPLVLEPHLAHSAAVMATGPSGQPNQRLKDMTPAEAFEVAATEAKRLLGELNAPVM